MQPLKLTVVKTYPIGHSMQRLILTGAGLTQERIPGNFGGLHIKLLFKKHNQEKLELPDFKDGKLYWPAADKKPVARTYSIADFDVAKKELTVDFVKHSPSGIACDFATQCSPGDDIGFSGPGLKQLINTTASNYLLVGDLSAVPAISAVLKHIPQLKNTYVYIELENLNDVEDIKEQYFSNAPSQLTFVKQEFRPTETILPMIRDLPIPSASNDWSITLAGEHQTVVDIRKYFSEKNFHKTFVYAVPYWRKDFTEEGYHEFRHETMDTVLSN